MAKYEAYPEYKDSGVEWIDSIPSHWEVRPTLALCDASTKKNIDGAENNVLSLSYGNIIPRNVEANFGLLPDSFNTYQIIDRGDAILRLTDLQNDKNSLRVGLAKQKGIITSAYLKLKAKDGINPTFLYRLLHSYDTTKVFYGMGGGLRQSMKFEDFRRLPLLLPPKEEQLNISAFLDHETAKIDNLIEKQQQLIELLKEKRQAVISHAVTKGLNPDVPMKDSGIEWLGEVPEHWNVCRLKQIIKSGTSISYGIVQPGDYLDEGVPFIQTTNVSQGNIDLDSLQRTSEKIERNYPRSRLEGGEVILGIRASIGSAYVVPLELKGVNLSRGVARIQPGKNITSDYLVWYFKTNAVEQYWALSKQGSTFSEVSIETVRELIVCVPPKDEQHRISSCLEGSLDKIHELIVKSEMQMSFLQERRTALISAAVTGKIDVRDWVAPANSEMANIEESPEVNA
ncbi:restriction endonuclease subunit S [Pectobacterium punjabense]|uniref:restriction endonuclease subunit S n=1 Tax=Pectobacterium punjabense TaxID=2108399 RepID=UPI002B24B36A|nr:restriction endonuclease subunit S [Pectobacterium punjabense]